MSDGVTPGSVVGLYQQLACRARRRGAGGAGARAQRRAAVRRASAAALEDAAGVLLHAATTFIALDGPLPGLFAEQAGALLAVAARFEEAADLTRVRAIRLTAKGGTMSVTRDRELPRRRRRPRTSSSSAQTADGRLAGARHERRARRRTSSTRSTGDEDGRPQAEAIARDYLTTVGASPPAAGRGGRRAHT